MTERKSLLIKLIATHVVLLPILLVATLIFSKVGFGLLIIDQITLLILYYAGYWEFFGMKFKKVFLVLSQVLILLLIAKSSWPVEINSSNIVWVSIIGFVVISLFSQIIRIIITIYKYDKEKVDISFPFSTGDYLITDGGNSKVSRMMNYHFHSPMHKLRKTNLSMLYATDIVKLSEGKTKFLPIGNENYPVFSEVVYCPMDGIVVKVVNDIADNIPYSGNYPYNTGNTVVIKKNRYYFLLGHMKKGSIVVNIGDMVNRCDRLGEAGNSGMSERPHLHMQLVKSTNPDYWQGLGINIQYQEKNLFKNRLISI